MARYIYLPLPDVSLQTWSMHLSMRLGKNATILTGNNCLQTVATNDTLYILVHGRSSTPYEVAGVDGNGLLHRLTAGQLVNDFVSKGLRTNVHITMKLYVCWGGKMRKPWTNLFSRSTSFGAELYQALLQQNYERVTLHAYTEKIKMVVHSRHMIAALSNKRLTDMDTNDPSNWDGNGQFLLNGFTRLSNTRVQFGPRIIRL